MARQSRMVCDSPILFQDDNDDGDKSFNLNRFLKRFHSKNLPEKKT